MQAAYLYLFTKVLVAVHTDVLHAVQIAPLSNLLGGFAGIPPGSLLPGQPPQPCCNQASEAVRNPGTCRLRGRIGTQSCLWQAILSCHFQFMLHVFLSLLLAHVVIAFLDAGTGMSARVQL